ncbi:alpha/beta hydrolase [Caldichromatium japonicum]|uniref:Alpha/beta hydrolase n=1 Tax=Caldichromatium japonicum TaxID=2699430 RepID=A0A6G7VD43_9GAMM|nr:alpha/beta hydrolase [Caldichromatium japonicum]QIK37872.1 alpha/beta hydrolase [Caldichromatium japonicum]
MIKSAVHLKSALLRYGLALALPFLAGCASPRLQHYVGTPTTPALYTDHLLAEDGYRLPLRAWSPVGRAQAVVLGLHGFNDYRRAFEEIGEYLAVRGIALYAYDQRGFGETAGAGDWFGVERLSRDAHLAARLIREHHPGVPLYLFGESMGGAVVLLTLAQYPDTPVDGAVLMAPAVWGRATMSWIQRGMLWLVAHTIPQVRLTGRDLNIRATDNDAAIKKLRADPWVIKDARVEVLWGLTDLMDQALTTPPPARLPVLILYGAQDQIIPKYPTCRWLAIRPEVAVHRLVIYPRGWHMLTRDLQGETVLADLAAWLRDPAATLPSGAELRDRMPGFCEPFEPF